MSIVTKPIVDILSRGDDNGLNDVACLFFYFLLAPVNNGREKAKYHPDDNGISRRDLASGGPHDGKIWFMLLQEHKLSALRTRGLWAISGKHCSATPRIYKPCPDSVLIFSRPYFLLFTPLSNGSL